MCVFHELQHRYTTFAVAASTRKVSRRPCTCSTTGNILILHKPLIAVTGRVNVCFNAGGEDYDA